jgi:hypothetical protein
VATGGVGGGGGSRRAGHQAVNGYALVKTSRPEAALYRDSRTRMNIFISLIKLNFYF